jgi:hypothetical protein
MGTTTKTLAKSKVKTKLQPFEKVLEWLEALDPMNNKATMAEKLLAHIELKTFVKEFITDEK